MGEMPWNPHHYRYSPGATSTGLNSKMALLETTKLMDARCFRQLESCYLSAYYVNCHEKSNEFKLHVQGSGRFVAVHVLKCCPRSFFSDDPKY